jgi:demethylmenaquinone methyltransferase/2-methoxy-6-polyprenyl-1,4-benzoquinol methylase/phosphoethanolamine N-methyltransferase
MVITHKHESAPETKGATIRWWAPAYDAVSWLMSFGQAPAIRRKTLAVAKLQPGERVLDVGCGPGSLSIPAAEKVGPAGSVAGIDASPEMIAVARGKARKKGLDLDFRVAPVEALPFADGEFDVVLSSFMLHHLPEDVREAGFAEVYRALKPGGRFVAVDLRGGHSALNTMMGFFGHRMPSDYADDLKEKMTTARFEPVQEAKTKFGHLAFIRARKPE